MMSSSLPDYFLSFPVTPYLAVRSGPRRLDLPFLLFLRLLLMSLLVPLDPENLLTPGNTNRASGTARSRSTGVNAERCVCLLRYLSNLEVHWVLEVQVTQEVPEPHRTGLRVKMSLGRRHGRVDTFKPCVCVERTTLVQVMFCRLPSVEGSPHGVFIKLAAISRYT